MKKMVAIEDSNKGLVSILSIETETGKKVRFRISDHKDTQWKVEVEQNSKRLTFDCPQAIEISLGGESECRTMVEALLYAAARIEDHLISLQEKRATEITQALGHLFKGEKHKRGWTRWKRVEAPCDRGLARDGAPCSERRKKLISYSIPT